MSETERGEGEGEREGGEGERECSMYTHINFVYIHTYRAATVVATSDGILWALVSALYSITCHLECLHVHACNV